MGIGQHAVKRKKYIDFNGQGGKTRRILNGILNINSSQYQNSKIASYKIELANIDLNTTLLNNLPAIIEELKNREMYIIDLDITQDFAGIFNKEEMRGYLPNSINFDQNEEVGNDCLVWNDQNTRVKIYNKFICEMTCPGIEKKLGNHIVDFIYNRDEHMRNRYASDLVKNHGITRLEVTIDNKYYIGSSYNFDDCLDILNKNLRLLRPAPFYSVPISSMWTKLTNELKSSLCVVVENILLFVYWGNEKTKKITGVEIGLPQNISERQNIIDYALSAFSFKQLPVYYYRNNELSCYYKKEGKTYFCRSPIGHTNMFGLTVIPQDIQIEETGLVNTVNVTPEVLRFPLPNFIPPYTINKN